MAYQVWLPSSRAPLTRSSAKADERSAAAERGWPFPEGKWPGEGGTVGLSMDMAVVIGSVVATRKEPSFQGYKLAIIQPIDENHQPKGEPFIAVDPDSRCGYGEEVYWVGGGDACTLGDGRVTPSDASIVGLIDYFHQKPQLKRVDGGLRRFRKEEMERDQ